MHDGTVSIKAQTTVRVDLSVDPFTFSNYSDTEVESVTVYVNGYPLSRMHPSKAIKLGLIERR